MLDFTNKSGAGGWQRTLLMLVSLVLLSATTARVNAQGTPRGPLSTEHFQRALELVKRDTKVAARFSTASIEEMQRALAAGDLQRLANAPPPRDEIDGETLVLESDYVRLVDLGEALAADEDAENQRQLYELVYPLASAEARKTLPTVSELLAQHGKVTRSDVDAVVASIPAHGLYATTAFAPPTQAECEAESGFENGSDGPAGTCLSYSALGIMGHVDFPLRDDLTCVRGQGSRGSCAAFGMVGAVESSVHVITGNKVNLSEQHAYWYGKTGVGVNSRYTDGLPVVSYAVDMQSAGYEFRREHVWTYNPAIGRMPRVGNTYSDSCIHYVGEFCTEYAYEGDEYYVGGVLQLPDPMPNAGAFALASVVKLGSGKGALTLAQILLDAQIPVVVGFDVTPDFKHPDANGYVTLSPTPSAPSGGHAAELAAWITNANLPAGAPAGDGGGYFVLRNSWREKRGDCGYFYVPYKYFADYAGAWVGIVAAN